MFVVFNSCPYLWLKDRNLKQNKINARLPFSIELDVTVKNWLPMICLIMILILDVFFKINKCKTKMKKFIETNKQNIEILQHKVINKFLSTTSLRGKKWSKLSSLLIYWSSLFSRFLQLTLMLMVSRIRIFLNFLVYLIYKIFHPLH